MSGFLVNKALLDPTVTQYAGGTDTFTLPQVGSTNSCEVIVGGVNQIPGVDFNVSGTTLTLTTAAPAGSNFVCVRQYFADGITGTAGANTVATSAIQNDAIDSQHYVDGSIDLVHMSSQSVDEDNLHISNAGSNGQYLQKQSGDTGGMTWATVSAGFTQPSVTATTSGTSHTISGIPSGTKLIYFLINGVNFNAHVDLDVTIGDSSGLETAGYTNISRELLSGGSLTTAAGGTGSKWEIYNSNSTTDYAPEGIGVITRIDPATNHYQFSYMGARGAGLTIVLNFGDKTLSGEITQISLSGGTFDEGKFNIMYI